MTQRPDNTIGHGDVPVGVLRPPRRGRTSRIDPKLIVRRAIEDHIEVVQQIAEQQELIELIAQRIIQAILTGGKILWCGNGGSAADSQHLAAEFVGRFRRDRRGLASVALTTDTSILTAIGNDYGYDEVFRRQVEARQRTSWSVFLLPVTARTYALPSRKPRKSAHLRFASQE